MELSVLNIAGQDTGRKVVLDDAIFGITPNEHAIYLDVKQFLANNRQGTHKSKQRNEVSGSTRKLKKQKGTGGARAGGIKNPEFRGGGRVFGPVPRDYSFKLNKKLKKLARKSALSVKAGANAVKVVEDFTFEAPKTKQMVALMNTENFMGPVNVGNDGEYTILELAKMIIELSNSNSKIVFKPLPSDDPTQRRPDLTLAKEKLGYEPTVHVRDGLLKTIEYFRNVL